MSQKIDERLLCTGATKLVYEFDEQIGDIYTDGTPPDFAKCKEMFQAIDPDVKGVRVHPDGGRANSYMIWFDQ